MNKAIADTNVVQDLALTPNTWLIPSNMIILKQPIPGYNNRLRTATASMRFGVNQDVSRASTAAVVKKQHQPIVPLTTLPLPTVPKKTPLVTLPTIPESSPLTSTHPPSSTHLSLPITAGIITFAALKYML